MKNKLPILLLILSVALAAISSCNGATAAGSSSGIEPAEAIEAVVPEEDAFDPAAVTSISFMGNTITGLNLVSSNVNNETGRASYHYNTEGNTEEYVLDGNGNVKTAIIWGNSYTRVTESEDKNLTVEEAQFFADAYISVFLGENHSMTLVDSRQRYSGNDCSFYFTYNDTLGGFRTNNGCRLIINAAGELFSIDSTNPIDYSDISDADLAEYTDEYIYGYAEAMLNLDHPGDIAEIEIGNIWLLPSEDGGFELKIYVNYRLVDDYVEYADQLILPVA